MVSDAPKHYPVLLNEIISIITPQHGGTFIDCTFGQGGYTKKILSYKDTQVISIDRDIESKKIADKFSNLLKFKFLKINRSGNSFSISFAIFKLSVSLSMPITLLF